MNRYCFIIGLIIFGLIETSCSLISKTPKGVNPNPVYDIKLNLKLDILSLLEDTAIIKQIDFKYFKYQKNGILIKGLTNSDKEVYEQIGIFQYNTIAECETEYQSWRNTFTKSSEDRLYKEFGDNSDKYFITYKAIHFNHNHGIPLGFINNPEIIICFKKNKYLLYVSYISYSDNGSDYIIQINSDLLCLSKVLKILNEKNK